MSKRLSLVSLILVLAWTCIAHAADSDVFSMPREQILAQTKRVGLMPVQFEYEWPRVKQAAEQFEQLATQRLMAAGIEVVPSSEYVAIEDRLKRETGGWFDSTNGSVNREQRTAILTKAREEFFAQHHLDADLQLRVDVVKARLIGSDAIWHGVKEYASYRQGGGKLLESFFSAGTQTGNISALSLASILYDKQGKQLYGRYGGLQPALLVDYGEFMDVDPDFIFSDPVRNARAVKLSLRPLLLSEKQIREEDAALRAKAAEARRVAKSGDATTTDEFGDVLAKPTPQKPAAPMVPSPALRVSLAELRSRVKVIALTPVTVSLDHPFQNPRDVIEKEFSEALAQAGFTVVPSAVYRDVYQRARDAGNNYYDPITGEVIEERRKALNASVFAELKASHQVDALLRVAVVEASAAQSGGNVSWDGVTQSYSQSDSAMSKWNASFTNITNFVPAVSLAARMTGTDEQDLFVKRIGVQTLRRFKGSRDIDVPAEEILTNEERNRKAIALLLEDLIPAPPTAVTPGK